MRAVIVVMGGIDGGEGGCGETSRKTDMRDVLTPVSELSGMERVQCS